MKKLLARGGLVAVLAAFMSLVMVTPAVAEGEFTPSEKIIGSGGTNYKYSFDYSKREYVGGTQWSYNSQPVSGTVHPAQTYYERKAAARAAAAAEKPLSGKIIEPGKTVVRAPSTYGPVTKFATAAGGVLGWSRVLGGIGIGIGGTSLPPANRAEIAVNQGVTNGCATGTSQCTTDETKKLFLIDSCGQLTGTSSCDAIGAKGVTGETDMQKWFRDEALPFLDDLWAKITGQKDGDDLPPDTHHEITKTWGCNRKIDVEYPNGSGNPNRLTLHMTEKNVIAARPGSDPQKTYFDSECSETNLPKFSAVRGATVAVTCMDPGGMTGDQWGPYGLNRDVTAYFDATTGAAGSDLCVTNRGWQPMTIVEVKVVQSSPQTNFVNPGSGNYSNVKYTHWLNPGKELQEDTKITTNWQCKTNDGSYTHNFSKSVSKTAAVVAPVCPPGSQLMSHDIKSTDVRGGDATTLDQGAAVPAEVAKYPLCLGSGATGCTIDVHVDGQKCTVGDADCMRWPSISALQPSRVQCYYGSYVVPTGNCNAIANGYQTETGVVFDPRADTWVAIDAHGNPVTPNPQPWNPTNPNPAPGVQAGTPPTTGTGTGGSTSPIPTTGTAPSTSNNCTAPTWSWNPVEWVYSPVVCALKDAFVPKLDVNARVAEIQTIAMDRPPLNWLTPDPAGMIGPGGGGCPNWVVTLPGFSQNVVCESSFTAAIVGARVPLFGLVATAMVWPLMRSLWYAAIPILRVSPASSK